MENFDKERREIVMNGELFIKLAKVEETLYRNIMESHLTILEILEISKNL